jgi:hypothetical protein
VSVSPGAKVTSLATAGLGFTQIVGWGTTFLMPSVLGRRMEDSLGIPSEIVFSGITVMFAVGAICSPRVGRLIDRTGARTIMAAGSVVYALSLAALAFSQGLVTYLLCWAGLGIASTLALSTPSSIAIAQGHHRRFRLDRVLAAVGRARRRRGLARYSADLCRPSSFRLRAHSSPGVAEPASYTSSFGRRRARAYGRAARGPLARLPAAVADALDRRLRVHRRYGAHD